MVEGEGESRSFGRLLGDYGKHKGGDPSRKDHHFVFSHRPSTGMERIHNSIRGSRNGRDLMLTFISLFVNAPDP